MITNVRELPIDRVYDLAQVELNRRIRHNERKKERLRTDPEYALKVREGNRKHNANRRKS